jgi:phage terminase large subunit
MENQLPIVLPNPNELPALLPYLTKREQKQLDKLLTMGAAKVNFHPQAKQAELLDACGVLGCLAGLPPEPAKANIIGYGGAAYGGKSYGLLGLASILAEVYPGITIVYFRRTYPELAGPGGAISQAYEVFAGLAEDRDGGKEWHFTNGSQFFFRHCQNEADVYGYQSQQYDVFIVDEATHFSWMIVDYLLTRNRATISGLRPFAVMTTNPGGVGHAWYSDIFDVTCKDGPHGQIKRRQNPNGSYSFTFFIPAFLADNPIGVERDPEYEQRLSERDPLLAKALLEGDWTVFAGQAFRVWDRVRHTCKPFEIPEHWAKWRAVDWGYEAPFCCLWFARDPDTKRLYVYREAYQTHLTDRRQASLVRDMTPSRERISITYADPSMWTTKNVNGIVSDTAKEYAAEGIILTKADNNHLDKKRRLDRVLVNGMDGQPGLVLFENCDNLIRTLPALVLDPKNPEDIKDGQEEHCYDALTYGLTNEKQPEKKQSVQQLPAQIKHL